MMMALFLFLGLEIFIVTAIDLKSRTISNYWSLFHLFLVPLLFYFYPLDYPLSLFSFFYPVALLFFGFIFFALKIMGAGDVKYLTTLFLITPVKFQPIVFDTLLIATTLFASVLVLMNLYLHRQQVLSFLKTKERVFLHGIFGKKIPYAPVFLLVWLFIGKEFFL